MSSDAETFKLECYFKVEDFSPPFRNILSTNAVFTDSTLEFIKNVIEERKLPVNARKTQTLNNIEKYRTNLDMLKELSLGIGNCLGIFMGNMLGGGNIAKAQDIAQSLTADMRILVLTEAQTNDANTTFQPILEHFANTTFFTPCTQSENAPKKAVSHLVLIDSAESLNFSLQVSTLSISVATFKDSDDQLA